LYWGLNKKTRDAITMKILLVLPHPNSKRKFLAKFQYPCLTLQQLASLTPKKHSIDIVDERYAKIDFNKKYDLVGISCLTYNSLRGYEIAKIFRKKKIPVVLGGYHPSLMPDEASKHADSIVIGEAEYIWPQLLKDVKKGKLKKIYKNDKVIKAEDIPPARHDIGVYTPFAQAVQATRGCPVGCEWCAMNRVEGKVFRARAIKDIIKEMKTIPQNRIFFADASLTINPKYTKKLFKEMKKLGKTFECFGNINVIARDDELLRLSKEAGVKKWYLGIESISQKNIDQAGKSTNKVGDYKKAIQKIKSYNIEVTGFFIFGLDDDTYDVFEKTLHAMFEWGLDEASFSILTPYPGTRLFERLEKEGRITCYDWSRYDEGTVNYIPKKLNEEELLRGIRNIALDFYSVRNCIKRSLVTSDFNYFKMFEKFTINFTLRDFYKNEKLPTEIELNDMINNGRLKDKVL